MAIVNGCIHIFIFFRCSHIVDSFFYCMFTPSQRCGTKHHTIMTTFKQPKSLQQTIVSGATRRAQLAKSIAKSLGMDDHNINNRRVIIDQIKNDCAICIIDFDFDNKIAIKIK